jgi:hypothetical protein
MAYISTEEVKIIRERIKKEFPLYKFSITRNHHTEIQVALMESDLIFPENYIQVNHYYIDRHYEGKNREVLSKIHELIIGVKPCYDRTCGDMGADYGDNNYFIEMSVGKWDKPYKTIRLRTFDHIMTDKEIENYQNECAKNRAEMGITS